MSDLKFLLIAMILCLLSCNRATDHVICTTEHAMINVTVINEEGFGPDSITILVYNKEDNTIYDSSDFNDFSNLLTQRGEYTIFHDAYLREARGKIFRIVVEGEKGNLGFTSEFAVSGDECHVYKLTGPDTVVLE